MTKVLDLTGMRFGRLVALRYSRKHEAASGAKQTLWLCRCDCGTEREFRLGDLRSGNTLSCGCLKSERVCQRNYRHGFSRWPEYHIWREMKERCFNEKHPAFHCYGGRGITVDSSWVSDFAAFISDVGRRPEGGYSIERINNDGNYEPGNVAWIPRSLQGRNKRGVTQYFYKGSMLTGPEIARDLGVTRARVYFRLVKQGIKPDDLGASL